MRRLIHRLLHGHWPVIRDFVLWEDTPGVRVCGLCLADAYREDERPAGKAW